MCCINGYCLGGGLILASVSDIRIAAPGATFGLPEITIGKLGGK
ncbi:MAG: enoyl-CoA hydratase-related protein [Thermincola sp.]|nr:enoyl-CoA hydratase-related protein [Thermincola sp.]MDT3704995.1 enoyl-CoA hydratase-related protein [Thermincola sp.]